MIGEFVLCTKGYEAGQHFIVLGEQEGYLLLVNGKRRGLETPKRKKIKHTAPCGFFDHEVTRRLQQKEPVSNRDLRRALAAFRDSKTQPGR